MADEVNENKTISKTNSGFPDYLDFEKLRAEGIEHLGNLAGKIWTDHNVHDPGITILEMLCYALLDLGYRTNLPAADIFARDPEDKSTDNNFFTPAQILTNNPLTITDYRKLLMDVIGVKNAWLEVANDVIDFCKPEVTSPPPSPDVILSAQSYPQQDKCIDYLNGLYHVYLELEDLQGGRTEADVVHDVKDALMVHRNLCEDFVDIFILCKFSIGVCADIELERDADVEKTYLAVVQKLREFFSPSLRFYTLQQLLDKQKPIEEIFAGRPHNLSQSHGFIDTDELEQFRLRKEIHLSDVYNVILQVEGIRAVSNLALVKCIENNNFVKDWKIAIPENHVPEFDIACSGFQFFRNNMPVFLDFRKYKGMLQFNFSRNGKVLYQVPSPYLDTELPRGTYHSELGHYYSIQNEFPRVYGIAEGGLPESASPLRKAQAYQLKGFLLFFDQFLANYLMQLKSIRSLFALSAPAEEDAHTYFISQLSTISGKPNFVPDLQKLLRFSAGENTTSDLGSQGSILAIPVDKKYLEELKESDQLRNARIEDFHPYVFSSLAEQTTAINQLRSDLFYEQIECELVTKTDDCVYFYILTCSDEVALIGKKYFKNEQQARENANTIKYIGLFEENYRSFITASDEFSFNIELGLLSFSKYLQLIVEDNTLFAQRRQGFLNHLLARFAERFTDFALLSYGFHNNDQLVQEDIRSKEKFLTRYDELSSNRGKAYDYLANQWNNSNVSGFEKKVKALSGIENWKRRTLCNFEVVEYEIQYVVHLRIGGREYFTSQKKFDNREEAMQSAWELFQTLQNKENDTFVSTHLYQLQLQDANGHAVRSSVKKYKTGDVAQEDIMKHLKKVNNQKKWSFREDDPVLGALHPDPDHPEVSIHVDAFRIDVNIPDGDVPGKFTYELQDQQHHFKFLSVNEFEDAAQANAHALSLLHILARIENYQVYQKENNNYALRILSNGEVQAIGSAEYENEEDAGEVQNMILNIVKQHQYTLTPVPIPYGWKFRYKLGPEANQTYVFQSLKEYEDEQDALNAADLFARNITGLQLQKANSQLLLVSTDLPDSASNVKLEMEEQQQVPERTEHDINKLLEEQKEIDQLRNAKDPEAFDRYVYIDEQSQEGTYVYRLVDKDNVLAFYHESYASRPEAELELKSVSKQNNPSYLELMPGGDITQKVKDNKNNTWYRYQVKCLREFYQPGGEELVLFESVKGYQAREEAEKAFTENYLFIINAASIETSYGQVISTKEMSLQVDDACWEGESIVFIPDRTILHFGNEGNAVTEIVKRARSFPIRRVQFPSKEFNQLFPCEKREIIPDDCKEEKESYVNYFRLTNETGDLNEWQSVNFYHKAEDAVKNFYFFLILLKYAGNFYVDCDDCSDDKGVYRIYIREVLAESTERFATEVAAWGKEGVQRFICIAQSLDAFRAFLKKEDCCYSFYVSCDNGLVYHPCRYDTPQKRDEVVGQLFNAFHKFRSSGSYGSRQETDGLVLLDNNGEAFARILIHDNDQRCISDQVFELGELAADIANYEEREGLVYLRNDAMQAVAVSYHKNNTIETWRERLLDYICHYPITKNYKEQGEQAEYCIEIKFPGFDTCKEDANEKPCACQDEPEEPPLCYIAWKSRCCYDTCQEAEEALKSIYALLFKEIYYKPVFECACGPYGIDLQFSKQEVLNDDNISYYAEEALVSNWHNGEVVAVNPQCYPTPEMACEAIERAKKLINSEGLHLVEHILLRPRCKPGDCECAQYKKPCANGTGCDDFEWHVPDEDPCIEGKDICFVPGADRYSFIATVVLPGWLARFRKKENRQLIENMLYREAPAHVLLRIIWLAPYDFCSFEENYKKWTKWLARKTNCIENFSVCNFLDFLFDRIFECPDVCDDCMCKEEEQSIVSCFGKTDQVEEPCIFLDQVNDLFCWEKTVCNENTDVEFYEDAAIPEEHLAETGTEPDEQQQAVYYKELPAPPRQQKTPVKRKPQIIKSRMQTYRITAEQVKEKSKQNPLAGKVLAFLDNTEPSVEKLSRLATEIINNKDPKEGKQLFKTQVQNLLQISISFYLDTIFFSSKEVDLGKELHKIIEKLKKAKLNVKSIYNYWHAPELKKYESDVKEEDVKQLFQ